MDFNNQDDINFASLGKFINTIYENFLVTLYGFISFLRRNMVILLVLVVVAVGLGFFMDSRQEPTYRTSVIVKANQNSTEYLYGFIDNFNFKRGDSTYLSMHGLQTQEIGAVTLSPIANFNDLLLEYFQKDIRLIETLLENASGEDILRSEFFRTSYRQHKMDIVFGKNMRPDSFEKFMLLVNGNERIKKINTLGQGIIEKRLGIYQNMFTQIDSTIATLQYEQLDHKTQTASTAINVKDENNSVYNLFRFKRDLLDVYEEYTYEAVTNDQPVVVMSEAVMLKNHKLAKKIQYPLVVVSLFLVLSFMLRLFSKMKRLTLERSND